MNASIELLRERDGSKMIGDSRAMKALDQDSQEWSSIDWSPRAEEAGLAHLVVVYPESVVASMSVDKVLNAADDSIERHVTDDYDEAESWIAER
jgi:hypothetical protein